MSLRDLFPSGRFSPPATESQIASVEAQLGLRLPDQLRCLYFECDGFREDKGNAKYLLSLTDEDSIGSLLSTTKFMWSEIKLPDLKPFIFFGFSAGDESWGIDSAVPNRIISYHHHMEDEYLEMGGDIKAVLKSDYAIYEGLEKKG
jgi:hypothetical protein